MLYLALTLGTTAAAPLTDKLLRAHPRAESLIDALLQVWIAGILLLHAIPHALQEGGALALAALLAGGVLGLASHRGERTLVGLALVGLLLHGLTDGAALATEAHLSVAVVLHTLPVALAVWRIASIRSRSAGISALLLTMIATLAGFVATDYALAGSEGALFAAMECLIAGILLHVIGHLSPSRYTPASGIGAVIGGAIALLQARPWEDPSLSLLFTALFIAVLLWGPSRLVIKRSQARNDVPHVHGPGCGHTHPEIPIKLDLTLGKSRRSPDTIGSRRV